MLGKFELHTNPRRIVAGKSAYQHRFGGPSEALFSDRVTRPIHVLFDLDLTDPALHFLGLNVPRLPLVFPLTVVGADIAYRIGANTQLELLSQIEFEASADWPYAGYPRAFPHTPVSVLPLSYEAHRAAVFRYAMGPAEWLDAEDQGLLERIGDPFTQIGGVLELPFGYPSHTCPSPLCGLPMIPFMTVWNEPIPGVELWGAGVDVQIVYSICMDCSTVWACNMCD